MNTYFNESINIAANPVPIDPLCHRLMFNGGNTVSGRVVTTICGHQFHESCLLGRINGQLNQHQDPTCPLLHCNRLLDGRSCAVRAWYRLSRLNRRLDHFPSLATMSVPVSAVITGVAFTQLSPGPLALRILLTSAVGVFTLAIESVVHFMFYKLIVYSAPQWSLTKRVTAFAAVLVAMHVATYAWTTFMATGNSRFRELGT